jgi:hypothetical protein
MIRIGTFILLGLFLTPSVRLQAQDEEFSDAAFFIGAYRMIGKSLEKEEAFLGRVALYSHGDSLLVERTVGDQTWFGTWALEYALGKEMRVLRMRFDVEGEDLEATYQWCVDFDNYPRLSGYLYHPKTATDDPGMEVLFFELLD